MLKKCKSNHFSTRLIYSAVATVAEPALSLIGFSRKVTSIFQMFNCNSISLIKFKQLSVPYMSFYMLTLECLFKGIRRNIYFKPRVLSADTHRSHVKSFEAILGNRTQFAMNRNVRANHCTTDIRGDFVDFDEFPKCRCFGEITSWFEIAPFCALESVWWWKPIDLGIERTTL